MPHVTPQGAMFTPSDLPTGKYPHAWYAYPITNPDFRTSKYRVTGGTLVSSPADIDYIGEITYLVLPEGSVERAEGDTTSPVSRPKAYFQSTTLDAQERGAVPIDRSLKHRREALIRLTADTASASLELAPEIWIGNRDDPEFIPRRRQRAKGQLELLERSRTPRRVEVRGRLPETVEVRRREEGHFNPGSTRAVLAAISDRLWGQLGFDAASEASLGVRGLLCQAEMRSDLFDLAMAVRLFAHASHQVIRQALPIILHRLCAKPFLYWSTYVDWYMIEHPEQMPRQMWRENFVKAADAELKLRAFNGVLSSWLDDRQLIDSGTIAAQRAMLIEIGFDDTYRQLSQRLQDYLRILQGILDRPDNKRVDSVARVIENLKCIMRNRFQVPLEGTPSTYPWTLRKAVSNDGRQIFVAQSRFGYRPEV